MIRYPPPLARSSDPLWSFEAAERARKSGLVATHCARILAVLSATGEPMTAHEIGARCGLNNVRVLRRMASIVADEKATEDNAGRVCRITHRRLKTFQIAGARPAPGG